MTDEEMLQCSKCRRVRKAKYIKLTKTYNGQKKYRCKARAVCKNIFNRKYK